MSRLHLMIVVTASLMGLPAISVASLQVGDRIHFTDKEGSTGGGEFGVHKLVSASPAGGNVASSELFRTFCIERTEYIDLNVNGFVIDSISKSANGGLPSGPDQIEQQTAWLFYNYTRGTLAGYDYTDNSLARKISANALQNAIWFLEGEIILSAAQQAANPFLVAANLASAVALQAAFDRVFVLNIKFATDRHGYDGVYEKTQNSPAPYGSWVSGPGNDAQSQLYVIPEPATLLVWTALALVALCARRSRTRN